MKAYKLDPEFIGETLDIKLINHPVVSSFNIDPEYTECMELHPKEMIGLRRVSYANFAKKCKIWAQRNAVSIWSGYDQGEGKWNATLYYKNDYLTEDDFWSASEEEAIIKSAAYVYNIKSKGFLK